MYKLDSRRVAEFNLACSTLQDSGQKEWKKSAKNRSLAFALLARFFRFSFAFFAHLLGPRAWHRLSLTYPLALALDVALS